MLQYSLSFSNRNAPVGSSPSDEHPLGLHLKGIEAEMLMLKFWKLKIEPSLAFCFDFRQVGDHRHLDGAALARFSNSFKSYMEDVSQFRHSLCFVKKFSESHLNSNILFVFSAILVSYTFSNVFLHIFTLIYLYCWSPLVLDFPCLVKSCTRLQFPSSLFQVSLLHLQLEAVSLDTFRVL